MLEINKLLMPQINIITDGEPVKTGRKIDNKDEYVKRISLGNLPNEGTKNVPHGLTNFIMTDCWGNAKNSSGGQILLHYFAVPEAGLLQYSIAIDITSTDVNVITGTNRSGFTGWINICFINNE